MKRFIVLAVIVALFSIGFASVQAGSGEDDVMDSLNGFVQPNTTYVVFRTQAAFDGVNRQQLFDFMGNPHNDPIWWSVAGGIVSSTQIAGDGLEKGATFAEVIIAGPELTWTNVVTLDVYERPRYEVQNTIGPVKTWSLVLFPAGQSSSFVSYSLFEEHPFLNFEQLTLQLGIAYQAAANHLGTTVEYSVVPLGAGTVTSGPDGSIVLPFDPEALVN